MALNPSALLQTLQQLGAFDTETSRWALTPAAVRRLGRAQSCYAARGFRGLLRV